MRVAVVTPYYREAPDVLAQCLDSVRDQKHPCRHFIVADGFPNPIVAGRDIDHIVLPAAHGDNGNFGRYTGSAAAVEAGYDVIAYLDADNWYRPNHIETVMTLHERTRAAVCTTGRTFHRLDGSQLPGRSAPWSTYVDTSCLALFRDAFGLIDLWRDMPPQLGPVCDRVFWKAVELRRIPVAHTGEATVAFRTLYANHYLSCGEPPPANAKTEADAEPALTFFRTMPPDLVTAMLLGSTATT